MANETIFGCVNWSTGVVTFSQSLCGYTGCVEWTGGHAGQIKVVVATDICSDTYYGCVNWTTGKFQLIIPDDCCTVLCPCSHCTTQGDGEQATLIYLRFLDASGCSRICFDSGADNWAFDGASQFESKILAGDIGAGPGFTLTNTGGCGYTTGNIAFDSVLTRTQYDDPDDCVGEILGIYELDYFFIGAIIQATTLSVSVYSHSSRNWNGIRGWLAQNFNFTSLTASITKGEGDTCIAIGSGNLTGTGGCGVAQGAWFENAGTVTSSIVDSTSLCTSS